MVLAACYVFFMILKENSQLMKHICYVANQSYSSQWKTGFNSKYGKTIRSQIFNEGYVMYAIKRNCAKKLF